MQKIAIRLGLWYVRRRFRKATVERRQPTTLGKLQWVATGAGIAFAAGYLLKPKTRQTVASAATTVKEKAVEVAPTPAPSASPAQADVALPAGVTMDVEDGIAFLRGEVPDATTIGETVRKVEQVDGVRAVQSLLTLPGSPATSAS